jgi:uncharacterized membrane protein
MTLYRICIGLHVLAMALWLGHMFVWSVFTGPAIKRIEPAASSENLRTASLSGFGLGWPALAVLVTTGIYMLSLRGIGVGDLFSGAAFDGTQGTVLAVKLSLVLVMIAYQARFGHRPGGSAIHLNILAALTILAASVVLVRGWVG